MVPYLPDFFPDWDLQPITVNTVPGSYVQILPADPCRAIAVIMPGTGGNGFVVWNGAANPGDGIQVVGGLFLAIKYKDFGPFVSLPIFYLDNAAKGTVDLLIGRTTPQWKVQQQSSQEGQ